MTTDMERPRHVFVSYHHEDNVNESLRKGNMTRFAEHLQGALRGRALPKGTVIIDVAHMTSDLAWREKIQADLRKTAVFVAIMTPDYLESETCEWEWGEYRKLYLSHDYPRTFWTVKLSPEDTIREAMNKPGWECARDQWEEDLVPCELAFDNGSGSQEWKALVNKVRDDALKWLNGELVSVTDVGFDGPPRVGQSVGVVASAAPDVRQEVKRWFLDGVEIPGPVAQTYTPAPSDMGKLLSAEVRFDQDDRLAVWETVAGVPIKGMELPVARIEVKGDPRPGQILTAKVVLDKPATGWTSEITWAHARSNTVLGTRETYKIKTSDAERAIVARATVSAAGYEPRVPISVVITVEPLPEVCAGEITLDAPPRVGTPVRWVEITVPVLIPSAREAMTVTWLADNQTVSTCRGPYIPTPADLGKNLTVRVQFGAPDHRLVVRESLAETVLPALPVPELPKRALVAPDAPRDDDVIPKSSDATTDPGNAVTDDVIEPPDTAELEPKPQDAARAKARAEIRKAALQALAAEEAAARSEIHKTGQGLLAPVAQRSTAVSSAAVASESEEPPSSDAAGTFMSKVKYGSAKTDPNHNILDRPLGPVVIVPSDAPAANATHRHVTAGSAGLHEEVLGLLLLAFALGASGLWGWSMAEVGGNLWWLFGCVGFFVIALLGLVVFGVRPPQFADDIGGWVLITIGATIAGGILLAVSQGYPSFADIRWWPPNLAVWTLGTCGLAFGSWCCQFIDYGFTVAQTKRTAIEWDATGRKFSSREIERPLFLRRHYYFLTMIQVLCWIVSFVSLTGVWWSVPLHIVGLVSLAAGLAVGTWVGSSMVNDRWPVAGHWLLVATIVLSLLTCCVAVAANLPWWSATLNLAPQELTIVIWVTGGLSAMGWLCQFVLIIRQWKRINKFSYL